MSIRRSLSSLAACGLVACAPGTVVVSSTPAGSRASPAQATDDGQGRRPLTDGWRFDTREHVDLWLHGFAMLQADSSLVPSFRLGYRSEASAARRAAGISSRLDEQATVLRRQVGSSPSLVSAQFVAMYFASWEDLRRGCQRFLRDQGEVRAAGDRDEARMYATLATYFPSSTEREFLRLYLESLADERTRFHRAWWQQEQSTRGASRSQLGALWNGTYGRAFERFLRNSGQRTGTILLTLPLGGEGRTIDAGGRDRFIAVGLPGPSDDPRDALFVVAHEVVGTVSNQVVRDHSTPADQQSGAAGRWSTLAAVRAGAVLLERIAPELADGYRRFYLRTARQAPGGDVAAQFERVFPLPGPLSQALVHQVDLVLNGI